jgi:tetratricopeptide (TPR) repeat protein
MALIEGYTVTGQYEEADAIIHNVPQGLRQHPSITARAGLYYVARGDFERANEILLDIFQSPPEVNILIVSRLALALGEVERALELMQRVVEERAWQAFWIRIFYRNYEGIQSHPRYLAMLRQIGLDDESVNALQEKLAL